MANGINYSYPRLNLTLNNTQSIYFSDSSLQNGMHFTNTSSLLFGTAKNITSPITKITSDYTLDTLNHKILVDASNNNIIISVPSASVLPRQEFLIKRIDSSSYTVNIQNENQVGYFENVFLTGTLANSSGDNFGYSIATNQLGNKLIIGAPNDELNGVLPVGSGVVYVYNSSSLGWVQEAVLTGSLSTNLGDSFGNSVFTNKNGDKIFVGAYKSQFTGSSADSGLAYSFISSSNGWIQETIFTGSLQKNTDDYFGISLACNQNGDKLIVGANNDDTDITKYGLGLLLHMENVSGTNVFIDSSPNNFSITKNGDAFLSTTQKKFGSYSGYFNGNGDGLTVVDGRYLAFGTNDFTIETWVYNIGNGQVNIFETRNGSEGAYPVLGITSDGKFYWYLNNNYAIISDVSGALNVWNHIAVSRKSGVTRMFLNGTQSVTTYSDSNNYIFPRLLIGTYNFGVAGSFYGYLDEYRIIVGTGLYTASFTPPASQFSNFDDYGTYNAAAYINSGAAYIFNSSSSGWIEEYIINSSNSSGNNDYDGLGRSVAMNESGNIVFVGAPYFQPFGEGTIDVGAIYSYTSSSSGWSTGARFGPVATSAYAYGAFGSSVACNYSGNVVFAGGPAGGGAFSSFQGGRAAIYKYVNNNWTLEKEITGSRSVSRNDQFGTNLFLNNEGNVAFCCAPGDERTSGLKQEGLVYLFISGNNGWQEKQIIINKSSNQIDDYNNSGINEYFGYSVTANENLTKMFIGSPQNQINNAISDTGLVYEYNISGTIPQIYSSSVSFLSDLYGTPTKIIYNSSSLPLTNDGNIWYFI